MTPASSRPSSMPSTGQRNIGLLGGTFNPIHRCHLTLAREVRSRLRLDHMLFVPTGDPPHKQDGNLVAAPHRMEMVRLAIEGEQSFAVSDIEVRRTGRSYSIDTVLELQRELGPETELYFCLGLDAFLDLESWRRPADLLRTCHFVVVSRPGAQFDRLSRLSLLPRLDDESLHRLDVGRIDTQSFPLDTGRMLHLLTMAPCTVSASMIRDRLRQGLGVEGLLPHSVERYIIRMGLYQERDNPTRFEG